MNEKKESEDNKLPYANPIIFDPVVEIADVDAAEEDFKESNILDENSPFGSYARQSLLDHQSVHSPICRTMTVFNYYINKSYF